MKAVIKTEEGVGNVVLKDVKEPQVGANDVKIRVKSAGICGTDVKIYKGKIWSNPPVILGHEFSGVVEKVGVNVKDIKVGDRVVSETAQVICGKCWYCNTSNYLMCPKRLSIGYGVDGAFADFCLVRQEIIHKLPENVSFDSGALCEPAAVAVHAVFDSVKLLPTDVVIVMGPGPIGLLVAQAAKSMGVTVVVVGTSADTKRLQTARELGMDYTVNAQEEDIVEVINEFTEKRGADVVYECTGSGSAIRSGMAVLKKRGSLVQVGLTERSLEIEYSLLPTKEISILGTFGHRWSNWETAIEMISKGKIKTELLITHHFSLEEWEDAFKIAERQEGIKILLHPSN